MTVRARPERAFEIFTREIVHNGPGDAVLPLVDRRGRDARHEWTGRALCQAVPRAAPGGRRSKEGASAEGYAASREPGAYDMERAFDMAFNASQRQPAQLPKLIAALGDPSEPVRWWAAQGCTILAEKAAPAEGALRQALADSSASVQVAAAEALARQGKVALALPGLERCLSNTNAPWAGLQAANVFDRLGEQARPSLPALRTALADVANADGNYNPLQYQRRILEHAVAVLDGKTLALVYPPQK